MSSRTGEISDDQAVILAVDDSPSNLALIKGIFERNYDVRLAKCGKMALNALDRIKPDIVLLDIEMPGMSGFELISGIRGRLELADVPIVLITAHDSEEYIEMAKARGIAEYIVKPFRVEALRTIVNDLLHPDG